MCDCQLSTKEKDVEEKNWLCSGLEQNHSANPLWKENSGLCIIIPQGMVAEKQGTLSEKYVGFIRIIVNLSVLGIPQLLKKGIWNFVKLERCIVPGSAC